MSVVKAGNIIRDIQKDTYSFLIASRKPAIIFTTNGYQLKGRITDCDENVVEIEVDGHKQMVYKHAISTVKAV